MYQPRERLFAFRLRREADGERLEGLSLRYTAIALIGLADEPDDVVSTILAGQTAEEVCGRLLDGIERTDDVGEAALALWAARRLRHPKASRALDRLRSMRPHERACPTVELAWSLAALVVPGSDATDEQLAKAAAARLLRSFRGSSGVFPHWPADGRLRGLRAHIACFADLVYPIQALSFYYRTSGSDEALRVARRCAERLCELQGPQGQWWWHYDVRSGRVVERFPVYAVHQDAMGPMALQALQEACGADYRAAIRKGVEWLIDPPEIDGSLIDEQAGVIWRKVARHEPGKWVRSVQAAASRLHPALRVPGVDWVFRPGRVDYESRPYHMGWILYAWPSGRASQRTRA